MITTPLPSPPADPMRGSFSSVAGRSPVPAGNYSGAFERVEYLPEIEADKMTGKGGRKWPCYRFVWRIDAGPLTGQVVTREVPTSTGTKSAYREFVFALLGRPIPDGEPYDLNEIVNHRYMLSIGPKVNAAGQTTTYLHVVVCFKVP